MPRNKPSAKVVGPRNYKRHLEDDYLPPALQEVLAEGDPDLSRAVTVAAVRAREAGEDITDPSVLALIIAGVRADRDPVTGAHRDLLTAVLETDEGHGSRRCRGCGTRFPLREGSHMQRYCDTKCRGRASSRRYRANHAA